MDKTIKILKKPITSVILAILFGVIVSMIILAVSGYNPFEVINSLVYGMVGTPKYVSNTIIKSVPLIMTGIGIAFAFKASLFNIGAEGQYIAGTIAATIVGVSFGSLPIYILAPLVLISGALFGAIIGCVIGILKAKFGIHEVITSIMFNWILFYLYNYVCSSSFISDSTSSGTHQISTSGMIMLFPVWKMSEAGTDFIRDHKFFGELLATDLNLGILIAILVAIGISYLLYHTTKGYEYRAVGISRTAAEFAGINVNKSIIQTMLISGAICGLGGALMISGTFPNAINKLAVFEGNGFNGIAVALIAGASPIGCIFSGLLFGGLIYAGQAVQFDTGAPSDIINIMIGVIVFFVALSKVVPIISEKLKKRRERNA